VCFRKTEQLKFHSQGYIIEAWVLRGLLKKILLHKEFLISTEIVSLIFYSELEFSTVCEVWLWSSRNYFVTLIPVHLQLSERGHLWNTSLEQLDT